MDRIFAIYARQSIDKPDSISIESQIERCRLEAADKPVTVYADRGFSGKDTARPQFQNMLEAVRRGEIDCVICYKLDRCSRSVLDFTQLMDLFLQYDVSFISCTEKFDTSTPMGRAMLNICIVFAQLERETIQQRITDAYHSRCKKGYFMGGRVPFGFSLALCTVDGKKTSCYQPVTAEAEILKRIYTCYQAPSASLADVVLALQEDHIPNPRRSDGLWVRSHIGRMIKNPIYVQADQRIYRHFEGLNVVFDNPQEDYVGRNGCYLYHIGDARHLVLAPHDGIIPADVWLRCQKGHQKRSHSCPPTSWLTGRLKCARCGKCAVLKQIRGKNGRIYRYFLCPGARSKDCSCEGFQAFSASGVETVIAEAMKSHLSALADRAKQSSDDVPATTLAERLMELAASSSVSIELLEQLLCQLHQQQTAEIIPASDQTADWNRLLEWIHQWEHIPIAQKSHIADLMISSAALSTGRIRLLWRV